MAARPSPTSRERGARTPGKLFFRIGEVARLVGVKPHVVRYWESEFPGVLRPEKTPAGHRLYRRRDVETLRTIERLLHQERYTIEGARRLLRQGAGRDSPPRQPKAAPRGPDAGAVLARVRDELREICRQLAVEPGAVPPLRIG